MLILSPKNIVSPFIESAFAPLSLWFSGSLCQYAYRQPYLTPPTFPWETCSWRFFEKQGRRKHPVGTRAGFATEKARNTPNNGALRAFFRRNLRARSERMRYSGASEKQQTSIPFFWKRMVDRRKGNLPIRRLFFLTSSHSCAIT